MKFAWRGEITAPPIRCPFSPQASSIAPAPSSCSGFLNTLPNVRLFVGCVALRLAWRSATIGLDLGLGPRREPELDPRDHLPVTERRVAVREAELCRREPAGALGGDDEAPAQDLAPVAAVGARVHPDAAARSCPGSHTRTRSPRARRRARDGGRRRSAPRLRRRRSSPSVRGLGELAFEPEHERLHARVGDEQVRAEPDRRHREAALARPRERLLELGEASRPGKRERRPARPDRGEARERDLPPRSSRERLQEQRHGAVDVAGARDEHEVVRAGPAGDDARRVRQRRAPSRSSSPDGPPRARPRPSARSPTAPRAPRTPR